MPSQIKEAFLRELTSRFGSVRKLDRSQSLFEIGSTGVRVYIRYSRLHGSSETFYGLRADDLRRLEGHPSFLCFLWDTQAAPLLIPFSEYEEVFRTLIPAGDGQYKAQVYLGSDGIEFYMAKVGRFSAEGHLGWDALTDAVNSLHHGIMPALSHCQAQTLLGAIGAAKDYDIWIPLTDRDKLDWSMTPRFQCRDASIPMPEPVTNIVQEIDVLWIRRGSNDVRALFEVEHSTPIYSGLLRFNDYLLSVKNQQPTFKIVANDTRRDLFVRQLSRPTFQASGLRDLCTFMDYSNVFGWHARTVV